MTVRQAANNAEVATALAASVFGDTIQLTGNGDFGDLSFTAGNSPNGLIVEAQTPGGPIARSAAVDNRQGLVLRGFRIQPNVAPVGTPRLLGLSRNVHQLLVDNLTIHGGYVPGGYADFDVTGSHLQYPEFGPPGGDTDPNPLAADYWYAVGSGAGGIPSGDLELINSTISDCQSLIKMPWKSEGNTKIKINNNKLFRPYEDHISVGFDAAATGAVELFEVCGNEFADGFAQPQDNANPHGDLIQLFGDDFGVINLFVMAHILIAGNVAWIRPNSRGQSQRVFLSDYAVALLGARVIENEFLSRVSGKGIQIASGDAGSAGGYVFRNAILANPEYNEAQGPPQNETTANTQTGIPAAQPTVAALDIEPDATVTNVEPTSFVGDNICESVNEFPENQTLGRSNIATGRGTLANKFTAYLDTPVGGWQIDTAQKAWDAIVPKAAYAAKGPHAAGVANAAALRARWATEGARPWNAMPSFVGFRSQGNVAPNTVITSKWSVVHAGNGSRAIAVGAGLEWRKCTKGANKLPNEATATAWEAAAGTIKDTALADGEYLQVRHTSAVTNTTTKTSSVMVGAETFSFRSTTISNIAYPAVEMQAGDQMITSTTFNPGDVDRFAFALEFDVGATGSTTNYLYGDGGGARRIVTAEMLVTGQLRVRLISPIGGSFASFTTTNAGPATAGRKYLILISADSRDAGLVAGGAATGLVNPDRNRFILVDRATGATLENFNWGTAVVGTMFHTVADGASTLSHQIEGSSWNPQYKMIALAVGTSLDLGAAALSDAVNRAQPALIGLSQQARGLFGVSAHFFLHGVAAEWNNAAGINKGSSAVKFVMDPGDTATDVGAPPAWPPQFALAREILTPGPYLVDQPISVAYSRTGYAGAAAIDQAGAGFAFAADPLPLAEGAGEVVTTITPTLAGALLLGSTNDGGYANPADTPIEVEDEGEPPPPAGPSSADRFTAWRPAWRTAQREAFAA